MGDVYTTLSRFSGEQVNPLGEFSLLIIVGEALHHRSEQITFRIVCFDSPNNMLLGRTTITELGMIPSTMHFAVLYQSKPEPRVIMSEYQDVRRCEGKISINSWCSEQMVTIERQLPTKAKQELIKLLKDNANVFDWQYLDMTGIHRTLKIRGTNFATEHKLNKDKKITPVQQKKRRMASEQAAITSKEVEELRKAGILKETRYQTWVANTVMGHIPQRESSSLHASGRIARNKCISRRIQRLSPNTNGKGGRAQDIFSCPARDVLLSKDAFWTKEYRSHLPE
nr:hypothetical protein [Tanacetum cinerariifolium]